MVEEAHKLCEEALQLLVFAHSRSSCLAMKARTRMPCSSSVTRTVRPPESTRQGLFAKKGWPQLDISLSPHTSLLTLCFLASALRMPSLVVAWHFLTAFVKHSMVFWGLAARRSAPV